MTRLQRLQQLAVVATVAAITAIGALAAAGATAAALAALTALICCFLIVWSRPARHAAAARHDGTALLAARKTLARALRPPPLVSTSLYACVRLPCYVAVPNVGYTCENPAETHQQ